MRKFTPEAIASLQENEIFVFGSNMNGNHAGGAARLAVEKFGAIEGQASGLQGQSFAIPTLDKNMQKLPLSKIEESIIALYDFAENHPELDFIVTKIGCGIAGFTVSEIANLFRGKFIPFNITLPMEFTFLQGVKGFDNKMKCRDMQYSENSEVHHEGKVKCCESGLHFVENPLEVGRYYQLKDENSFCQVEGFGKIDTHDNDSKVAISDLKISAKLKWLDVVKIGFDFTMKKREFLVRKAAQNGSTLAAKDGSTLAAQNYSTLAAQNDSTLSAQNYSTLAAQDYSTLAAQNYSTLAAQNDSIIACRRGNTIELSGSNNIVVCANGSKVKGKKGNVICFVDFDNENNIKNAISAIIDGKTLKEDVFYKFENGKIVEF